MSITFPCSDCGQRYQVGYDLAGKRMKCKKCGSIQTIPVPRQSPAATTPASSPASPPVAAPRPAAPKPAAPKPSTAPVSTRPKIDPFALDEDPFIAAPARSKAAPDNVYDLDDEPVAKPASRGEEIDDFVMPRPGRPGRPKPSKSRNSGGAFPSWLLMAGGGLGGLFLLLLLVGIFSEVAAQIYLGGILLVGVVVMMCGGIWMLVNAFNESTLCGFFHVCPFISSVYPIYYLITRWHTQWRPFATQMAGLAILLFGGGLGVALAARHGSLDEARADSGAPTPPAIGPGMTPDQVQSEFQRFQRENERFAKQVQRQARANTAKSAPAPVPNFTPAPPPVASAPAPPRNPSFTPGGGSFSTGNAATPAPAPAAPTTPQFTRGGGFASNAPALWKVAADPSPRAVDYKTFKDVKINIPSPHHNHIALFPSVPSEFVLVGRNENQDEIRELWDLKEGKRVTRLAGKVEIEKPLALSGDGSMLAGRVPWKNAVVIFDLKKNTKVGQLDFPKHAPDWLDFAGNDRLALGFFWDNSLQVWDLAKGEQTSNATIKSFSKESTCVSPGGKYLATIAEHTLRVYDTSNGAEVGMEPMPKGGNNWDMNGKGLAFSPDGKELVALGESFGKLSIVVWEAETGRQVAQFGPYENDVKQPFMYEGQAIEWLPGKEGWLVYGDSIVDRESGKKIWSLPFDNDNFKISSRRILGLDRALAIVGKDGRTLAALPLEKEKLAAASRIAREGGNPIDAALPGVKAADLGGARRVNSPNGAVAWSAAVDPQPAANNLSQRPVTLKAKPGEVVRILFSGPGQPVAAVSSQPDKPFAHQPPSVDGKPLVVDRFDLTNGKAIGRQELAAGIDLVAISPGASAILTGSYKDHERLDAFDTAGKPIAGWRPYEKENGDDRQVVWADFLDESRVLTMNKGGTLVLWALPDCKAEYVLESASRGLPAFSPGRKSLALFRNGGFRLIDPATGEARGDTTVGGSNAGPNGVQAVAFLPDGRELAAVIGTTLVRWELGTGKSLSEFPVAAEGKTLEYCGPNHVLLNGNMLYDLDRRKIVWYYNGGILATGSPDAMHWLVLGNPFNPGLLGSLAFPDPSVDKLVAQSEDKTIPAIVKPGAKVSVALEFGNPPRDADNYRKNLTKLLAGKLTSVGAAPADGQPVKLVARITEKPTGETVEFRQIGPGRGRTGGPQNRTIRLRNLDCELSIVDGQGSISIAKSTMHMRQFGFVHMPAGETDVEAFMFNEAWKGAESWFRTLGMPSYVARGGSGVIQLPGNTDLGQLVK